MSKSMQAFRSLFTRREHEVNVTRKCRSIEGGVCVYVCTVYIAMYLWTIHYRYLKCTFLDVKNCTWEITCNHNKDSSWPADMLTAVEFLTPVFVYIKHVCTLPLFYIQIHEVSIPGSFWFKLSTKWCWLWHGYSTQEPALMRDGDYHTPTVLIPILVACPHLTPGSAGIKQSCSTPKSWLPQEESHETGMSGYTSERRRLPLQHAHTHVPYPNPPVTSSSKAEGNKGPAVTKWLVQLPYVHPLRERILHALQKSWKQFQPPGPLFGSGVVLGHARNVQSFCKANLLLASLPDAAFMAEDPWAAAPLGRSPWQTMVAWEAVSPG